MFNRPYFQLPPPDSINVPYVELADLDHEIKRDVLAIAPMTPSALPIARLTIRENIQGLKNQLIKTKEEYAVVYGGEKARTSDIKERLKTTIEMRMLAKYSAVSECLCQSTCSACVLGCCGSGIGWLATALFPLVSCPAWGPCLAMGMVTLPCMPNNCFIKMGGTIFNGGRYCISNIACNPNVALWGGIVGAGVGCIYGTIGYIQDRAEYTTELNLLNELYDQYVLLEKTGVDAYGDDPVDEKSLVAVAPVPSFAQAPSLSVLLQPLDKLPIPPKDMEDRLMSYGLATESVSALKMHGFICPITTRVMNEPVMAADGHSYEKNAIETWLSKKLTSPMTGAKLPYRHLNSNHLLRNQINEYVHEVGNRFSHIYTLFAKAKANNAAQLKTQPTEKVEEISKIILGYSG